MAVLAVRSRVKEAGVRKQNGLLPVAGVIPDRRGAKRDVVVIGPQLIPGTVDRRVWIDVQSGAERIRPAISPSPVGIAAGDRKVPGEVECLGLCSGEERKGECE